MNQATKLLASFQERYGKPAGPEGPGRLVREVFGVTPDDWQDEVLQWFGGGERRISVRSCHGVGKTALAAWLVWVMLLTRYPQKSVATAPGAPQLEGALIPEIKMWGKELPPALQALFDIKAKGIYLASNPEASYFEARTSRSDNPEALQGVHSDNVLLIGDEASGIPEAVYEAAIGSMSGEHATTLLIGNPVRTSGLFFDTHHKLSDMWRTKKVGHTDSPRVTEDFVTDVLRRYGEKSNAFRVRCLGEFPLTDHDTVIPWEDVESAREREMEDSPRATRVWGADLARFGSDRCALSERTRRSAKVLDVWEGLDLMESAGRIKHRYDNTPDSEKPDVILIDSIGMGGGVHDRLHELGLPVREVNVAETASLGGFQRARSELWWNCREWLAAHDVSLAKDDDPQGPNEQLARELVMPKYKFTSTGKIQVESKSDMKKRERISPDIADSLIVTFAEDLSLAVYGSAGGASSWNESIKRGLSIP